MGFKHVFRMSLVLRTYLDFMLRSIPHHRRVHVCTLAYVKCVPIVLEELTTVMLLHAVCTFMSGNTRSPKQNPSIIYIYALLEYDNAWHIHT